MDILPIQASAVPCERIFSSSKLTMTQQRTRIHPRTMEALQVLKFSTKDGLELSFTDGMDEDTEMRELEEVMAGLEFVPNELTSFGDSLS